MQRGQRHWSTAPELGWLSIRVRSEKVYEQKKFACHSGHATHRAVNLFFDDISPLCGVFCVGGSIVKGKELVALDSENALIEARA